MKEEDEDHLVYPLTLVREEGEEEGEGEGGGMRERDEGGGMREEG